MGQVWDHIMKFLARENPQAFVSMVLKGARFEGEVNRELIANKLEADLLYRVVWKKRRVILHIEFQSLNDKQMRRRVWEYNVLTDYLTKLPVISIVIYLVRRGTIVKPLYVRRLPDGRIIQVLQY